MKNIIRSLFSAATLVAASLQTHAQGFVYDQQSATGPSNPPADDFFNIQEDSPLTQSFIPTLSAIGFVQFEFWDIANRHERSNGLCEPVDWFAECQFSHITRLNDSGLYAQRICE